MPVVRKWTRPPTRRLFGLGKAYDPLNAVADELAPMLQKTLVRELSNVLSPSEMADLVKAVRTADIAAIETIIPAYDPRAPGVWQTLERSYKSTVAEVTQRAGNKALMQYGMRSAFTIDNPYTQKWLAERTGKLIKEISDDTRSNIAGLVQSAWTDGIPPNQLADLIRPHVGLTENQAALVQRRYEGTLQSLEDGGMSRARAVSTAASRTEDYALDLVQQRAETIARTETIAASTAGAHDAWDDAKDKGLLPPNVRKEWVASPEGGRACEWCVDLDGERVDFDDAFKTAMPNLKPQNGEAPGHILRPPLHPNCRCVVRLIIPGLNDQQSLDQIREENERDNP